MLADAGNSYCRKRTTHRGVKLLRRVRKHCVVWIARWRDADSRRLKEVSLSALGLNSAAARRRWCTERSKANLFRRAQLLSGAALHTETAIQTAIEEFFTRRAALKPITLSSYRNVADAFFSWAKSAGVATTEALGPRHLMDFRAWWAGLPARAPARGKNVGRGTRVESTKRRSPLTINRGIGVVRAMLNEWRTLGAAPQLSSDLVEDILRYEKRHRPLPHFLRAPEIAALVNAALRHDSARFTVTRHEHYGRGTPGATPRHAPISPLILIALLTGCRLGEMASLRWASIALSENEIHLAHTETKTKQARRIDLGPTPLLARLFAAMMSCGKGEYCLGGASPLSRALAEAARKRLIKRFGAPRFTWHALRRTCGTFLTCAPSIFGGASAFLSAKRLGHSVVVAESAYVGALSSIDRTATTLEAAMGITIEQVDQAAAHWTAFLSSMRPLCPNVPRLTPRSHNETSNSMP